MALLLPTRLLSLCHAPPLPARSRPRPSPPLQVELLRMDLFSILCYIRSHLEEWQSLARLMGLDLPPILEFFESLNFNHFE